MRMILAMESLEATPGRQTSMCKGPGPPNQFSMYSVRGIMLGAETEGSASEGSRED